MKVRSEFYRYLPISERDRRWGLFAYGGGHHLSTAAPLSPPHPAPFDYEQKRGRVFADEYAALCITEGATLFESDATGKVLLSPGDCVILLPGLWHRYSKHGGAATAHLWLAFGGDWADDLLRRGVLSRRRIVYHVGLSEPVLHPYRRALGMLQANPVGIQQALAGSVVEILGTAVGTAESRRAGMSFAKFEDAVRQAITLMEQRADRALDLPALASELSVHYDRFRHAFRQQTGHSPYQYHLDLRMKRAQELLLDPALGMKQVAAQLGFRDAFQFSKAFKKKTGLSPSQWRTNAGV